MEEVNNKNVLIELEQSLKSRKTAGPESSYVAQLLLAEEDVLLRKIAEEATEVVLAAKSGAQEALIKEIADLWFHTLVTLMRYDCRVEQVLSELHRRRGISGIAEKQSRDNKKS